MRQVCYTALMDPETAQRLRATLLSQAVGHEDTADFYAGAANACYRDPKTRLAFEQACEDSIAAAVRCRESARILVRDVC